MTDVSLREYIQSVLDEREKAHEAERKVLATQLATVMDEVQELKRWRANMDGRFWALGVGLTVGLAIFTAVLRFLVR